jgi:membrane-associated phospholipid phosphatase
MDLIYLIDGFKTPLLDSTMWAFSESIILVVPLIVLYLRYKRNNKVYPLILSLILTWVIVTAIKQTMPESRPCNSLPIHFIECDDPMQSFPSMHTAIAFTPLVFLLPDTTFFIIYLAYALIIGFTRLYLGVHYPHDILAGAIISLIIGIFCIKIQGRLVAKKKLQLPSNEDKTAFNSKSKHAPK